ncbi:outer membrane protein transport protein [Hymenobacter sp. BT186]|uniref:Outer membrane protein transport protein n=1 Tax=Hymenobacter telluris TaxID=2816474 RepID=A0A939EVK0_9BACT|nr:outer membrane protein transport protein [Hymenobacter telluris]MBO0358305.1 outer membrane protein transport protein [Hymenobacter telluris]MBW3374331.1 outer membrane protein transport protein [Hymenobacter norwichensis]
MDSKILLLAGGALLSATVASAGGYQVTLAGQKNNGMGGVGVGLSLDQAAMFYNPGALAMVRDRGVQVGVNFTLARNAYVAEGGSQQRELRNSTVTPFNLYAGFGPAEGKFRAGIAVYTPFGSKLQYANGWEGRTSLTDITLESIYVQPTFSYAITDKLSIGAGLMILAYGAVNLQRDIALPDSFGHIELDGKAEKKLGYNAGIFFKPSEKLSVGISHRSKIDAQVKGGDVTFSNISSSFASRFEATKFDASLPLPATTSLGIGVMPNENLTIGLDVNFVQWSAYRVLRFDFDKQVNGNTFSESKRYYQDALTFRVGGQYKLTSGLTVRAGGSYDATPVKDGYVTPETPDNDRVSGTLGASYSFGKFGLDISGQYISIKKRTQTAQELLNNGTTDRIAGTYKTNIVIPGLGLNYNF